MRSFRKNKSGVLYIYAVLLVTLLVMGFFWFAFYSAYGPIRYAIVPSMAKYDNDSTYNTFEYAETFVNSLFTFFLVIICLGLAYWVYNTSQQKGDIMYG